MQFTRREFMRGGVAAFTVGFAAPAFLSELARAQSATGRSLVVLYLSGGNDALSTLVPYTDPSYYSRRPAVAVPAGSVLQVGADLSGRPLGLHPSLTGLKSIFDAGRLAIIQRTGYADASRSHFKGTDILATANPQSAQGTGWLGRYLDTLPSPVDPLSAWNTANLLPHALQAATVGVPSIPNTTEYAFSSPNTGVEAEYSAAAALAMSSHLPVEQPQLSFVNSTAQTALATLDRVGAVAAYTPTAAYPDTGLGRALQAVAGSLATQVGTKIFWVQTGGYDTHASQGTIDGGYANLLNTLDRRVTLEVGSSLPLKNSPLVDHGQESPDFVLGRYMFHQPYAMTNGFQTPEITVPQLGTISVQGPRDRVVFHHLLAQQKIQTLRLKLWARVRTFDVLTEKWGMKTIVCPVEAIDYWHVRLHFVEK